MLSFPVRELLADPSLEIPVETEWNIPSVDSGPDTYVFDTPWKIKGHIINIGGDRLAFIGTVDTQTTMPCARCLKPTKVPLHIDINQRFIKGSVEEAIKEGEEIDILPIENDRVDLDDTILSEVRLGIPMRVLCKEDCKGLCPICGKDLNEGPCLCQTEDTDPRWDALKDLFRN